LIDGAITVTDIHKRFTRGKSRISFGDIIIGVETNFSNNIQLNKVLMQNAKSRLRVLVMRKGQPVILYIKGKSIL
jgi:hypothetical protein